MDRLDSKKDVDWLKTLLTEHTVCIISIPLGEKIGNGIQNALVGNGLCDDETNYPHCNYDGFECCGSEINTVINPGPYPSEYSCEECLCKGK